MEEYVASSHSILLIANKVTKKIFKTFIHAHAHAYLVIAKSRIVSGHGPKSRQINGRNQPR